MTLHPYSGRMFSYSIVIGVVLILATCSDSDAPPSASAAKATAPASAADSSPPDTANAMAGMDHSKMPGMEKTSAPVASSPMAGMDHSKMLMNPTSPPSAPAMDHAMMGAVSAENAADRKLQQIVARLVQDSIVLKRIGADSVLRARWLDSAIKRIFLNPSGR